MNFLYLQIPPGLRGDWDPVNRKKSKMEKRRDVVADLMRKKEEAKAREVLKLKKKGDTG
jgi:hypothetical protein